MRVVSVAHGAKPMPRRILIIDDSRFIRLYLARLFRGWGTEPTSAASAEDALSVLEQLRPDLITLDLNLGGGLDGAAALPLIKELAPTVPVLIVSSADDPDLVAGLLRAGAADFVAKPFRKIELCRACERALDREDLIL